MKRYLIQRSLLFLPTLFGALTLVFFLIHLVPGDPIEIMLGETASAADKEELRRSLALDQPLMVQYRNFLTGLLSGDLGRSLYEQSGTQLKMVASPLYHRLHIVQLRVMHRLTGEDRFARFADRWESYGRSRTKRTRALCYKTAFKLAYY